MSSFVDAKGREWEIPHLDPFAIEDVKQECDVSLYELPQKLQELGLLLQNTPKFAHVLWVLVRDQAKGRDIDQRNFAKGLIGGDVLERAGEAFWQEILFFSPPETRKLLEKAAQQTKTLQSQALTRVEQQVMQSLTNLFGESSGSQDSSPKE
jgi:hypothetical protein